MAQIFVDIHKKGADADADGRTVIYTDALSVYNASIYQITATFEADVRRDGMIFRGNIK